VQVYLPIAEIPVSVLLILGMGAAVGFISGLFGIGGGFLMTPLLIFVGIPPAIAVGSQQAQIAASSLTSTLAAWRRDAIDLKLSAFLLAGGFTGTVLGVLFFNWMRRAGQLEIVIVLSYVTLFTIVGGLMLKESVREFWSSRRGIVRPLRRGGDHPAYLGLPFRLRFPRSKLYASVITTLAATVLHAIVNDAVDVVLALTLIVGGVFGAQFGSRAGRNLKAELFRFLLAILVLSVGLRFGLEIAVRPVEPFSVQILETRR
jgi:uncharacterized membrane protein YfcA